MSSAPDPDLLPIGQVVAELQASYPDVSHSSLRFLEREGLITSIRTPGGHRLYYRADVERIRQIKMWQAQRLSLDQIRQRLQDSTVCRHRPRWPSRFFVRPSTATKPRPTRRSLRPMISACH